MPIGHIISEYIDGQFLAVGCGSRQRQVADGADVVFTGCRRLGEKSVGRKTFGRIIFGATDDWATTVISKKTVRRQRPKQFAFLLVLLA